MTCEGPKCNEHDEGWGCSRLINLHCQRCNRFFCSNHWWYADDEIEHNVRFLFIEDNVYQMKGCDYCLHWPETRIESDEEEASEITLA